MTVVLKMTRNPLGENEVQEKSNLQRYHDLFDFKRWAGREWRRRSPQEIASLLFQVSEELAEDSIYESQKELESYNAANPLTKLIRILTSQKWTPPRIQTRSEILDKMAEQCLRLSERARTEPGYDWFQGNSTPFMEKPIIVARLLRPHQPNCP